MKKKFYGLLVMLLLVLSLGLFSISYAVAEPQEWTWENILDFSTQIASATSGYWQNQKDGASLIVNNNLTILNTLSNNGYNVNDYSNFLIETDSSYLTIYMFNYNSDGYITAGSSSLNVRNITGKSISLFRNNLTHTTNKLNRTSISLSNSDLSLTYGLQSKIVGNYYNWRLENFYDYVPAPSIYFTPNHDHIVTQNSVDYNTLLRSYSVNQWKIGETTNFSDLDAFHMFFYDLVANVQLGYVYAYQSTNTIDGGNCLYYSPANLYVNSRYIRYNNPYRLDIYKYLDGVETIETYYYLFLPRNAIVENGVIINAGSGDYTVQDSTNDLINEATDTSAIDNTKEALLESGELVKRLNYQEYPNHSYEILFALTRNLCDTLYYSGDTYIDISIGDWYTHRFYASDFYIPVNGLTYWIYMALIFGYCYLLYRQGSELIHAIQEGDLYVLELEDADEYFYM